MRDRPLFQAVKRAIATAREAEITDRAAALTYYGVLSLFPAVIVLVSILGVAGHNPETTDAVLRIVDDVGPGSAVDTLREPIRQIVESSGGASVLLAIGILGGVWTASGYIGAFERAVPGEPRKKGEPFWKARAQQLGVTAMLLFGLSLVVIAVIASGSLAEAIAGEIGIGSAAVDVWEAAKWPATLAIALALCCTLYRFTIGPAGESTFRSVLPGAAVALLAWLATSLGFAIYVANFSSYNATYGALGGVIVFLMWLWITNIALLFGAHVNAALDHTGPSEAR